jgi:hypothetical protein
LLAVLKVRDQSGHANTKMEKMHMRIIDAIAAAKIQVRNQSLLVSEAQDCEALTVVMLQHLDYHQNYSASCDMYSKTAHLKLLQAT